MDYVGFTSLFLEQKIWQIETFYHFLCSFPVKHYTSCQFVSLKDKNRIVINIWLTNQGSKFLHAINYPMILGTNILSSTSFTY